MLKVIYGLLIFSPTLIIVVLLILACRSWRRDKLVAKTLVVLSLLTYISASGFLAKGIVHSLERKYYPPDQISGDVIIMLGGGATLDTPNIGGQGHLYGSAANRLLTVLQLHRELGVPIIVSGGKVFSSTGVEAHIAKSILLSVGVPASDVIIEDASLNTTENALNCTSIINKYQFKRPILVTSAFHMERSVIQFKKAGLSVTPFPTDYIYNVSEKWSIADLQPTSASIVALGLKEYLGIAAAKWY